MRQLKFSAAKDFIEFKKVANMFKLLFTYIVSNGVFIVLADAEQLERLGY